jgi:uncharacterized protein (DUF4415 family)
MTGSKANKPTPAQVAAAVRAVPREKDFVWDGVDEDDRPLTAEEMRAGIEAWRQQRKGPGRPPAPAGSQKESTTIRFDREVLEAFKSTGPGWQTRINAALKDWLKTHSPV